MYSPQLLDAVDAGARPVTARGESSDPVTDSSAMPAAPESAGASAQEIPAPAGAPASTVAPWSPSGHDAGAIVDAATRSASASAFDAAPRGTAARDALANDAAAYDAAGGQDTGSPDSVETPVIDACPNDTNKAAPGVCGCGTADVDTDGDETYDCVDACPQDPDKTTLGACGCNHAELDSDLDGTADCVDACPYDADKTATGACGCGKTDSDRDDDGTADCVDACPDHAHKTHPGACGCHAVDPADPLAGALYCAKDQLLHRYRFDGYDNGRLIDSVTAADGRTVNALQRNGSLWMSGDRGEGYNDEAYGELPNGIWKGLESVTLEAWIIWRGAASSGDAEWQRVFDFGDQTESTATRYLFLTPNARGGVRVAFALTGQPEQEITVTAERPAPRNTRTHLACVVDHAAKTLSLFHDGALRGQTPLAHALSELKPQTLWLGRSHFPNDPAFHGEIVEFRIYGAALSEAQLTASETVGPDYSFAP